MTDPTGSAVVAAPISADSPDLIGGGRQAITDAAGIYRLADLAPGTYQITADVPGFKRAEHGGVVLPPDATVVVDVGLELDSLAESVKVSSRFSIVDITASQVPARLSAELLDNLPTTHVLSDVMNLLPGINVDIGLGGVQRANPIFNDGVNATSVGSLAPWTSFNYNWVEDVEVVAVAADAEYGEFNGVIQKNRLRSGGNRLSGLAEYRVTRPGWVGSNTAILRPSFQAGVPTDPERVLDWWDSSAQIGGPLRRDRVWFFAGLQASRDNRRPAIYDGAVTTDRHDARALAKIDGAPRPSLRISGYYEFDRLHISGVGVGPTTSPEAASTDTQPDHNVSLHATWSPRPRLWMQFEHTFVSGTYSSGPTAPATRNGPYAHFDNNTFVSSGNAPYYYDESSRRRTYGATFVMSGTGPLRDHELKGGIQHERARSSFTFGFPGGRTYDDFDGVPFQVTFIPEDSQTSNIHRTSAYLQDRWSVGHRLTLHPGLRITANRGIVSQGTVLSPSSLSPRIGVAWDVAEDHKTVVRAHFGRYHDTTLTYQFSNSDERVPPPTIVAAVLGPEQFLEVSRSSVQPRPIDPSLSQPFFDQYVAGVERELWGKASVTVQAIRRSYKELTAYVDLGSVYEPVTATDPGPDGRLGTSDDGSRVTVFRKTNPGNERYFYTNPPGIYRQYSALQIIGRQQYGSSWQMQASYALSSTRGNAVNGVGSSATGPDLGFNGTAADPNRNINADGPVPFDFTHEVKLLGVWRAPWWNGVNVGAVYQYHTGTAWSRTARFSEIQFVTFGVRVEPRGARRTAALNTVDLRVEKTFDVMKRRMSVFADALNLNNQGIPDPYARRPVIEFSGPTFGTPMFWMAPRVIRAGARILF